MSSLRRRVLDYSFAGLLLLLPLVILRSSLKEPEELNGFDRAVLKVSSPLQSAVSWMVEGVGGLWQRYIWLVNVEEENDELRAELVRKHQELAAARRQLGDTQVLERLIDLRERTSSETVGARVVGGSTNPFFRVERLRIDRGGGDRKGVSVDQAVIDSDGALVGRIHRTYGDYADVLLLTDPLSWVMVQVERTGKLGFLGGAAADDRFHCQLTNMRSGDVEVGDVVVTSGKSSKFPAGLIIGKVTRVEENPVDMFLEVEVEPAVDFARLSTVLVLTASPPAPDPDDGKPAPAPTAYGLVPQ